MITFTHGGHESGITRLCLEIHVGIIFQQAASGE